MAEGPFTERERVEEGERALRRDTRYANRASPQFQFQLQFWRGVGYQKVASDALA